MKRVLIAAFCLQAASMCLAESNFGAEGNQLQDARWEFGLQAGYAMPIGNKSVRLQANNSAFLVSDPSFIGEDEFAENGLPSPDFNGQSTITGDIQNEFSLGGHAYYRLTSWVAAGIEGSVMIRRGNLISQAGAFQVPIYSIRYSAHGAQIAPVLRLGGWMGGVRPYVMGGAGAFIWDERFTADLVDPDDPDHAPIVAGESTNVYLSTLWGGGIDVKFFEEGSVGFVLQYQRVFKPVNNLQFVVPALRFDYHF